MWTLSQTGTTQSTINKGVNQYLSEEDDDEEEEAFLQVSECKRITVFLVSVSPKKKKEDKDHLIWILCFIDRPLKTETFAIDWIEIC